MFHCLLTFIPPTPKFLNTHTHTLSYDYSVVKQENVDDALYFFNFPLLVSFSLPLSRSLCVSLSLSLSSLFPHPSLPPCPCERAWGLSGNKCRIVAPPHFYSRPISFTLAFLSALCRFHSFFFFFSHSFFVFLSLFCHSLCRSLSPPLFRCPALMSAGWMIIGSQRKFSRENTHTGWGCNS